MNNEVMEVEETTLTTENEDNSGDAGAMLVILGIGAAGALIGIGAMKLGSVIKRKIQKYRENKKVMETVDDTDELAEA